MDMSFTALMKRFINYFFAIDPHCNMLWKDCNHLKIRKKIHR